ncbi:hypothetical protein K438DRAFT_1848557 [Mycena galopus ATCC 62051]|nr:hypothetical protein K438DRAFT_1848557 [Mycena galopus ATCC 62051]
MSEQRVYRKQTGSNVWVVIRTCNYQLPTEHTPFQGVEHARLTGTGRPKRGRTIG